MITRAADKIRCENISRSNSAHCSLNTSFAFTGAVRYYAYCIYYFSEKNDTCEGRVR